MKLAVFPLPIFLLPGGITRLRIFEPRYIRMVKEAATGSGFILSQYDKAQLLETSPWGNWVEIVNFETLEDGLLGIDVKSKGLVALHDIEFDNEKLRYAYITQTQHWQEQPHDDTSLALAKQLKVIFKHNPDFAQLYPEKMYDSPNWICARLLEVLPLSLQQKETFINQKSFHHCLEFLKQFILGNSDL